METYVQKLHKGIEILKKAGVPEPELDAWYLFSECFQITRAEYFLKQTEKIEETDVQKKTWEQYLKRRSEREPLQYILGTQEFMGFSFLVNPSVLIPRQDTEILVEKALSVLNPGDHVLDMCTGSGCILLSLAKMKKLGRAVGVDISSEAIQTAGKNAEYLQADAEFILSDLFDQMDRRDRFQVIVSNPPYITAEERKELMPEVAEHEPGLALFGGEDGLYFYRRMIREAGNFLTEGGSLLVEIGCRQAEAVQKMFQENGYEKIEVIQDLAGLDRVVAGTYFSGR